ncbi:MAG TPA: sigma-54 dependent transcriptional regulator [Polyangia bacterium]|jgi:two-component system response regulator HydG
MRKSVLVVGNEPAIAAVVIGVVRAMGFDAAANTSAAGAIARLSRSRFALVIVDLGLPADEGAAVIMKASACRPAVTTLALTAHGSVAGAVEALRAGAADVVSKPFHTSALRDAITRVTSRRASRRATPGIALVGDHPGMRRVLEHVDRISDTDASVLIRGETGTGKEVIARLIHGASGRRTGPFVAVNMAAIPDALAEAELFGHARGAFSDAEVARPGRLVAASGGTLFLDEIGGMPRALQGKLLRALQDHEVTPVGGRAPVRVDVRVVAATQCDVDELLTDGRLREDLYYRLDVVSIDIPPLRARREDIPALAEHFRREVNARENRSVPGFAPDVMQRLSGYDWPGNVRELQNLVERAIVIAGSRMVAVTDLPPHMRPQVLDLEQAARDLPFRGVDLPVLLCEIEDRMISEALGRAGGNEDRAARLLRLSRHTLVEKLRRRNVA